MWLKLARKQGGDRGQKIEKLINEIKTLSFDKYSFSIAFLLRCIIELAVKCFCDQVKIDLSKYNNKKTKIIDFKLKDCLGEIANLLNASWFDSKSIKPNNAKELERAIKFLNGEASDSFGYIGELNDAIHRDAYTPSAGSLRVACININILMRLFLNDDLS